MRRISRVDDNQPLLVKALQRIGAVVIHTHQLKNAFDILVAFRGSLFVVEIKDLQKLPAKFIEMSATEKESYLVESALTEGELECRRKLKAVGVEYHIVWSVDEVFRVIGADRPLFKK